MTILITGGRGVIGSRLTEVLRERGYEVVVNDMRIAKQDGYRRGDVTAFVEMHAIFKEFPQIDTVFHLAGEVGRENGENFPRRCVDINVSGTLNLVQLCLEHGARLLFASTSEVYGHLANKDGKLTEDLIDHFPARPTNVYGLSKLQAEHYLRHFSSNYGLRAIAFRFFMCYGVGERPDPFRSAMANFIHDLLRGRPITVHSGTARSWCYIDDIVEGMIAGMLRGRFAEYTAYNIGRDDLRPMDEVARVICRLADQDPKLIRLGDLGRFVTPVKDASFELAARDLGFVSKVPLEEGIRRTIEWQRRHVLGDQSWPSA